MKPSHLAFTFLAECLNNINLHAYLGTSGLLLIPLKLYQDTDGYLQTIRVFYHTTGYLLVAL